MTFQIVITEDGSLSCLDEETQQLCHNRAGAYTEAMVNYVRPSRLLERILITGNVSVLDACYGLGYNTWALVQALSSEIEARKSSFIEAQLPFTLSVVAIEKSPEILRFLPQVLEHPNLNDLKSKIKALEHNIDYRTRMGSTLVDDCSNAGPIDLLLAINEYFHVRFTLWIDDLRHRIPILSLNFEQSFDAIFHDPFSPQKMPELWSVELFQHYANLLRTKQGLLLTYSTAAAVRAGLIEAGFHVYKKEGLGKKAGATLALVDPDWLLQYENEGNTFCRLDEWETAYLQSKAGIPYRDPGLNQGRADILSRRENEQIQSGRVSGSALLKLKAKSVVTP